MQYAKNPGRLLGGEGEEKSRKVTKNVKKCAIANICTQRKCSKFIDKSGIKPLNLHQKVDRSKARTKQRGLFRSA